MMNTAIAACSLALSSAGRQLERLIKSVNDTPLEVLTLSNEAVNLELVISSIEDHTDDLNGDQRTLLQGVLANSKLDRFVVLADEMLRTYAKTDFKMKRRRWIKDRSDIMASIRILKELRLSIAAAITNHISSILQSTELRFTGIASGGEGASEQTSRLQQLWRDHAAIGIAEKGQYVQLTTSRHAMQYVPITPSESQDGHVPLSEGVSHDGSYFGLCFSSYRPEKCTSPCKCACHTWYSATTPPPFFSTLMGALLVGYAKSPLRYSKCDRASCRKATNSTAKVSYFFPPKIVERMVSIVYMMTCRGTPTLGLTARRVITMDAPEMVLSRNGDVNGMQSLISQGLADPRSTWTATGETPLHISVTEGHFELSKLLLDQGCDPYLLSSVNRSPMLIAWQYIDGKLYEPLCAEAFSNLFSDPDRIEDAQYTIIHRIILGLSTLDLRTELLRNPSLVDIQDVAGQTPLSWAAARDDVDNVITLLSHGANPNLAMNDGITPLMHAASAHSSPNSLLALLKYGADVSHISLRGYTALHLVAGEGNGADYVRPLMEAGIDINVRSTVGATALAVAANKVHPESVAALLEAGADPEIPLYRDPFLTPVGLAIRLNRHESLEIFLGAGASLDMVGENGDTVLHRIAAAGDCETMAILACNEVKGIAVGKRNGAGRTAQDVFRKRKGVDEELLRAWGRFLDAVKHIEHEERAGNRLEDVKEDVFVDALEAICEDFTFGF